ncbi:MAG: energy transducer TonB [Chitinophagaceae bacterium]
MKTDQILSADVLDILFDGRNKAYGAYILRKDYSKRMKIALSITFIIALLSITLSIWAKKGATVVEAYNGIDVNLIDHSSTQKENTPPTPKPVQPKTVHKQAVFVTPTIVRDNLYDDQPTPPDQSALDNVVIGGATIDGIESDGNNIPPVLENASGGGLATITSNKDYEETFVPVQIPASFPGGLESWKRYLERNLNRELPSENGAAPGIYSVVVSFTVDEIGNISDTKIEKDPGFGTADEAVRIIKKGPKWTPAIQNGKKVMYRVKQVVSFVVENAG